MREQLEIVSLEILVDKEHQYRKFIEIFHFGIFNKVLKEIENKERFEGFSAQRLFKCVLLQHLEDLSDRELEEYLKSNVAGKWFCEFSLLEKTPDHSTFSKFRSRLGIARLEKMFLELKEQLKKKGFMNEFFTVIDATHLISKANLWEERDKARQEKYEKLNNETLPKVARDKDARIGCKGKNKYWYGYKATRSIDMQSGLINKTYLTGANIHDIRTLEKVLPERGAIYCDKGFSSKKLEERVKQKGCILRAVKKNNAKDKNQGLDKFITRLRAPYERMFSKMNKRARYIGKIKNYFSEILDCMSFNLKRLVVLNRDYCV